MESDLREIRVLSRGEKNKTTCTKIQQRKAKAYLGDVCHYFSVLNATRGVDFIFHAAALEQVPSCEFHPMEAVQTNILGTENLLEAAIQNRIKRVVCLGTCPYVVVSPLAVGHRSLQGTGYRV